MATTVTMKPMSASSTSSPAGVERVRRLAHLLDNSIQLPGGFRIGWDALLGLIPGLGDSAGALLYTYIVLEAVRMGAPSPVLARMVGNVAIEAVVGAVPFLGDLFDAAFKANARNVRLLETHLAAPGKARRASRWWVVAVVAVLLLVLVGVFTLAYLTISAIVN